MASFSAREHTLMLISACARSTAAACEKCTMYTGAWFECTSSDTVSWIGVIAYRNVSGTGRCAEVTTAVDRPVRRVRSFSKKVTSPSVADMRRNCAFGSSSSGTCHAQPRSGSE